LEKVCGKKRHKFRQNIYEVDVKIALMTDCKGKGLWLQVGEAWYCVVRSTGEVHNEAVGSQNNYAKKEAAFYKDLSSIVLGEDDDSRSS
jgi:hypothetical protein